MDFKRYGFDQHLPKVVRERLRQILIRLGFARANFENDLHETLGNIILKQKVWSICTDRRPKGPWFELQQGVLDCGTGRESNRKD